MPRDSNWDGTNYVEFPPECSSIWLWCSCSKNKAFIDIRLRRGIWPPLVPYDPLRPNVTASIKPEVHNVSQRRQRRTKSRPQGIHTQNFVTIGPAFQRYDRGQTDRQTHRQTDTPTDRLVDHNTPHLPRRSKNAFQTADDICSDLTDVDCIILSVNWLTVTGWRSIGKCGRLILAGF